MRLLHGLGPAVGCIERVARFLRACRASWRQHRDRRLLRSSIPGPDRAATYPSITDRRWQPLSPCESRPVAAGEALRVQSRVWMSQERPLTVRRMGRTTGSTRAATRRPLGTAWPDWWGCVNVQPQRANLNPRSSNAFASTSGRMLSSVMTVATPSFICCPLAGDPSALLPAHVIDSMPHPVACPRPVPYGAMQVTHHDCTAGYKARDLN